MLFLSDLVANEEGGIEILKNNVDDKTSDFNQPAIVNAVTKLQKILQENASETLWAQPMPTLPTTS